MYECTSSHNKDTDCSDPQSLRSSSAFQTSGYTTRVDDEPRDDKTQQYLEAMHLRGKI